ncbi:MAG: LptF/LptG family permease, partial [Candidatus Cloacimonetes bacterium]|nr:LptF/LptG family permease [Candidatus Cloacimonadota bacterium]
DQFTVNIRNLGNQMEVYESGYRSDREMTHEQLVVSIADKKLELEKQKLEINNLSKRLEFERSKPNTYANMQSLRRLNVQHTLASNRLNEVAEALRALQVEYHKKYALSFAIIIFVLIGIPLGLMTRSSGIGMAFSVSSIIFLIYYVALTGGEQLADKGIVSPFWSMWLINLIFLIVSIILIIASIYEKKLIDLHQLTWKLSHMKAKKQEIPDEIIH